MLDHVGLPVADMDRSRAFYTKVLAVLGYELVTDVSEEMGGGTAHAGFGVPGKPQFWISPASRWSAACTWLSQPRTRTPSTASITRPLRPARRITALPVSGPIITQTITAPSFLTPMDTTSRLSATSRRGDACRFA